MNINEIAKLANVSRATVSRYLNNGYVSAEKKEQIRKVIEETGYIPSSQAQMLRTRKTGLVGVILPKINSDSISRMVAGIGEVLAKAGYQLLLATTNNDWKEEITYLQTFRNRNVDGVILIGTIISKEHKELLAELSIPLVMLGQQLDGHASVYHDDYHAAKAVSELLVKESQHIAYIGVTPKDKAVGKARLQGFEDALSKVGIKEEIREIIPFSMEEGYHAMKNIMETIPQVDGVFCATDRIAIGAMKCIREKGKKIPEDIQIVGVGDSQYATIVTPTLTSVHFYYKTSGQEAAKLLLEMLQNKNSARREIKMGYEVVKRESVRG